MTPREEKLVRTATKSARKEAKGPGILPTALVLGGLGVAPVLRTRVTIRALRAVKAALDKARKGLPDAPHL